MEDLGFPPLQLSRFPTSVMMHLCDLFCNSLCARNLGMRFLLRGRDATSHDLVTIP
jgi:hypothetical protein